MVDNPAFELFKTLLIIFPLWLTAVQIIFKQHRDYDDINAISPRGFQMYLGISIFIFLLLMLVLYSKFKINIDWMLHLILLTIIFWVASTMVFAGMTILNVSFIEEFQDSRSSKGATSQTEIYDFSEESSE
jgi:hypothetical protein